MIYLAAFLTLTVFVIALWMFGIVAAAAQAVAISRNSIRIIRDPALSDDDKERALRRASLTLFGSFLSITARGAAAFGASLLPMVAFDAAGLARFSKVADFLVTWQAILIASVMMTLAYLIGRRI